ncbi:ketopantoate reductase family protein [Cupriavidus necator]
MTRVCIVGAGAIGGFIGAKLAAAGHAQVSALARGATLEALRAHGWRLNTAQGLLQSELAAASEHAGELGVQDLVVIAVKGPALAQVVRGIGPLIGPATLVMPAMNGVPWWFCRGVAGFPETLRSIDPTGEVNATLPFEQVIGCVVHASTSVSEPGLVQHKLGQGLIVGEPVGGTSERVQRIVDLLSEAGFDATHSTDIRFDIWYKLWGNMTMNPVSAITGATGDRILADPLVRGFCSAAMAEAQAIGARIGCPITQSPEDRHEVTARLGAFRTSMLQDADAGRAIELDGIVGVVQEIGERLGIATPCTDILFGLARLFGCVHGLYPQAA